VNGDGTADLDSSRIYYFGQSMGGIYGTVFMAVEPDVRAGVLNVPGGPLLDLSRFEPLGGVVSFLLPLELGKQVPSLLNGPGNTYIANVPLRDQPPLVDSAPGAEAIQAFLDDSEWIDAAGEGVPYAQHLRKEPLAGMPAKSIVVQFAKGDETVVNPLTTALLRAGNIGDRATYFRNDLAFADHPGEALTDPHGFLLSFNSSFQTQIAGKSQGQIATFFESDGDMIINPDSSYFEVPIVPPLPEDLNFLP
jgi:pimeloyl-ACP methyl ester carboxylesterase